MTAFELASRYLGLRELNGSRHQPCIQWCLSLCGLAPETPDEVPLCAAFCHHPAFELSLPRSHSAAARSWLAVGTPISLLYAEPAYDIVILTRGPLPQPGPEVTSGAPGHVGWFAGRDGDEVLVLGGNQRNAVSVEAFAASRILGLRRLKAREEW